VPRAREPRRERHYGGVELAVALMLHRTDGGEWTDEGLWPFTRLEPVAWSPSGSPCGLRVRLATGREYVVDFADVEGRLAD
jgi:hypothetical protein